MRAGSKAIPNALRAVAVLALITATGLLLASILFPKESPSATPQESGAAGGADAPTALRFEQIRQIATGGGAPSALAVGPGDRMFVADGPRVNLYDAEGQESGGFTLPAPVTCLAAGPSGRLFAGHRDHVAVYSARGEVESKWTSLGQSACLTSLAVSGQRVLAADAGNRIVWCFDTRGTLLLRLPDGATGENAGRFIVPSPHFDVAWAQTGEFWVTNPGMRHLEKYTETGRRTAAWGYSSQDIGGFCGCCNPTDIAVCADGRIVTAEKGIPRVKVYSEAGSLLGVVASRSSFQPGTVGLDLAVDSRGRILVLDPVARAVRVFAERSAANVEGAQ